MAIGLINLGYLFLIFSYINFLSGKGKEITDTEIPISSTPSLKERLIKLLNGGERRLAYLSYDRVECPGMRIGNFASNCGGGSNLIYSLRRYTPGGSAMDGIGAGMYILTLVYVKLYPLLLCKFTSSFPNILKSMQINRDLSVFMTSF